MSFRIRFNDSLESLMLCQEFVPGIEIKLRNGPRETGSAIDED